MQLKTPEFDDQAIISEQFMLTQAISGLLLLHIPLAWSSARLDIRFAYGPGDEPARLDLTCPTPAGCDGEVLITEDILQAARRLETFLRCHGAKCRKVHFTARKNRFGTWSSKNEFEWENSENNIES